MENSQDGKRIKYRGGEKVAEFKFNEDFANNWKSGQIVTCEEKEGDYLVGKVALIEKDELLKHGEFITVNVEILGYMETNGVDDLFVYDRDFQPGDTVQHFKGGLYKIVAIGINTETEEKMVVYQSLKDQRVWIRPYDMFISKVDREKYPNAYQPYRLIKVKITA